MRHWIRRLVWIALAVFGAYLVANPFIHKKSNTTADAPPAETTATSTPVPAGDSDSLDTKIRIAKVKPSDASKLIKDRGMQLMIAAAIFGLGAAELVQRSKSKKAHARVNRPPSTLKAAPASHVDPLHLDAMRPSNSPTSASSSSAGFEKLGSVGLLANVNEDQHTPPRR
jgi:hypothetical protein